MVKSKNPYAAIIHLNIEIYQILSTGELDGKPISKQKLLENGIYNKQIVQIKGFDLFDCLKNLTQKLSDLKNE